MTAPTLQANHQIECGAVIGEVPQPPTKYSAPPSSTSSEVAVVVLADMLDDLEGIRIRTSNRLWAYTDDRAKGLPNTREAEFLARMVDQLAAMEHQSTLALQRAFRTHPLAPWVRVQIGLGEKQVARLLASIGDPYWHPILERPRTVSQLWAYCGLHVVHPTSRPHRLRDGVENNLDGQPRPETQTSGAVDGRDLDQGEHAPLSRGVGVAPKHRRGTKANWNAQARMRIWLIAKSCIMQLNSPYRTVYLEGREKYAPLDLTDGHKHARAQRLVMKAILRDIWIESRRLHKETP